MADSTEPEPTVTREDDDIRDIITTAIDDSMDIDWISEWATTSILDALRREGFQIVPQAALRAQSEEVERLREALRTIDDMEPLHGVPANAAKMMAGVARAALAGDKA